MTRFVVEIHGNPETDVALILAGKAEEELIGYGVAVLETGDVVVQFGETQDNYRLEPGVYGTRSEAEATITRFSETERAAVLAAAAWLEPGAPTAAKWLRDDYLGRTESSPSPQWCPVCKTYHYDVGEQTDAGLITRACPNLPTDDPRYYGSPLYTGDRGR